MNRAGFPPTTVQGDTSLNTALRAPTTAPRPTFTPMPTKACAATHAWSSTVMGAEIRAWAGSEMSWEAVQRKAPWEMTAWFPMEMGALL